MPSRHTNPSRKRSFLKTLFKPEEFENAGFSFECGWKHLMRFWSKNAVVKSIRRVVDRELSACDGIEFLSVSRLIIFLTNRCSFENLFLRNVIWFGGVLIFDRSAVATRDLWQSWEQLTTIKRITWTTKITDMSVTSGSTNSPRYVLFTLLNWGFHWCFIVIKKYFSVWSTIFEYCLSPRVFLFLFFESYSRGCSVCNLCDVSWR